MDLKVNSSVATHDERDAVDSVLGKPTQYTQGGTRTEQDLRVSRAGEALRNLRHMLLPTLHAVNDRIGWISRGSINYIAQQLDVAPAEIYGVASFYALFSTTERPKRQVHVCIDLACRAMGGLREDQIPEGTHPSPCLGTCERAPAVLVIEAGNPARHEVLAPATPVQINALAKGAWPDAETPIVSATPQADSDPTRLVLLSRIGKVDPLSISDYQQHGGFDALRKAMQLGASGVIDEVNASGLVGRGGAAFPTGRKWGAVAGQPAFPHYSICNADESEPGTFKDRVVMEGDPFALVEAMIIASFATGCEQGFIYLRGEYPRAIRNVQNAIDESKKHGFLGDNILGSGFNFALSIIRGAGAYICGEETAIFNSIEGYRGEPRNKPPFPVEVGVFGKPTLVNNVETLVNVLSIVKDGGSAYSTLGTEGSKGRKLFCLSGAVARPGIYEVEFGITLRQLIELGGGLRDGSTMQAILLGGASGGFVGPSDLDLPLTMEATRAAGLSLGSGVVMVLDQSVDMVDQLRRIAAFFRDESCGQCVPCRVGTVRQEEIISRLARGVQSQDIEILRELGTVMRDASICGLGQTANSAIDSAINKLKVFAQ